MDLRHGGDLPQQCETDRLLERRPRCSAKRFRTLLSPLIKRRSEMEDLPS